MRGGGVYIYIYSPVERERSCRRPSPQALPSIIMWGGAPPSSLDEPAMGGPWRSRRCTGRVVGSDSHYKRDFTRAARGSQRPRALARGDVCGSTRSGRPDVSFATKVWVGGQRCAGRVAASDLHYKRQFTRAARGSQRPRSRQRRRLRTRSRRPDVSFATRAPRAARAVSPARVASGERL